MSARFNDHLHLRRGVAEDDAFLLQPHLRHCDSPQASWYRLLLAQFVKALTLGAASLSVVATTRGYEDATPSWGAAAAAAAAA